MADGNSGSGFSRRVPEYLSTSECDGMIVAIGTKNDLWRGYKYYVAFSVDGGYTWIEGLIDTTYHKSTAPRFRRVKMFSRKSGLAVGDSGMIIRTEDSAKTWKFVDQRQKWQYRDVAFDAQGGAYVTGSYGVFGRSLNGGATWDLRELVVPSTLNNVIAKNTAIYLGDRFYNRVFRSTDEGVSWDTLIFNNISVARLQVELLILDDNSYVSVGISQATAGAQKPHILYSADGIQWVEAPHYESMYDLTASDSRGQKLVAGGRGSFLYTSTDNGYSWSADSIETTGGIAFMRDISILPDGNVVASVGGPTSSFVIRSSTNAGVLRSKDALRYSGKYIPLPNDNGLLKEYKVFDSLGRLIKTVASLDSSLDPRTLSLPNGIYLLREGEDFNVLFSVTK